MTPFHHRRQYAIASLLIATLGVRAASGETTGQPPPSTRVRSGDPVLAGLIERGARQSATFRRLLETIDATDGIVYVEPGPCPGGVRACLRMWMQMSGANRLLRVSIDTRKAESNVELIGSIGHELQHASEALSERAVTNGDRMYNFFRRYAPTDNNRFETIAAVNEGNAIRDELRRLEKVRAPPSDKSSRPRVPDPSSPSSAR